MKVTPRRELTLEQWANYKMACGILCHLLHHGPALARDVRAKFTAPSSFMFKATVIYTRTHTGLLARSLIRYGLQKALVTLALTFNGWVIASTLEEDKCLSPHTISFIVGC